MAWVFLVIAGILEVGWALGLKASNGLTRPGLSALTVAGMLASFYFLARAMRTLPVGTAYTVWTGIGAVGAVVFGIVLFGESRDPIRIVFISMIVLGVVGLKVTTR